MGEQAFLVTFRLSRGQIQRTLHAKNKETLRQKLVTSIASRDVPYIEANGAFIFKHHIKSFHVH